MNAIRISLSIAILAVGFVLALPNGVSSLVEKKPDTKQPENTMMGKDLEELGIKICPDKLHLCPGTADCCQLEDGKWDCCPKASSPISGDCCHQLGFLWTCCTPLVPKCHWWGCWWT